MKLQAKLVNELALLSPDDARPWADLAAILLRCCGLKTAEPELVATAQTQNPDRLLHDIALQSLRNAGPVKTVLDAVLLCLRAMAAELLASQDFDIITARTLPCLSGLLRALEEACVPLPTACLDDVLATTNHLLFDGAGEIITQQTTSPLLDRVNDLLSAISAREDLASYKRRLRRYWERTTFSSDIIVYRVLRILRNVAAHILIKAYVADSLQSVNIATGSQSSLNAEKSNLHEPAITNSQLSDFDQLWKLICDRDIMLPHQDTNESHNNTTNKLALPITFLSKVSDIAIRFINEKKEIMANAWQVVTPCSSLEHDDYVKSAVAISINCFHIVTIICLTLNRIPDHVLSRLIHVLESTKLASSPVFIKLHIATNDCLGLLARKYVYLRLQIQKNLSDYLLSPSKVFDIARDYEHSIYSRLRRSATMSLAKTLQNTIHVVNTGHHTATSHSSSSPLPPPPPQLLFTIINTVQRRDLSGQHNEPIFENGVTAIAAIACRLNTAETIDIAVSSLVRMLTPQLLHSQGSQSTQVIRALTDISLSSNAQTFDDTIQLFAELAKITSNNDNSNQSMNLISSSGAPSSLSSSSSSPPGKSSPITDVYTNRLSRYIVDCIERLARSSSIPRRKKILLALLGIFVDKASTIQQIDSLFSREQEPREKEELSHLMDILGAIMRLISRIGNAHPISEMTAEHIKLFRTFWFFVVLLEFISPPLPAISFMDKYHEYIVEAALNTPVLFSNHTTRNLESDLVSESVVKSSFTDQNLLRFREKLQKIIPQLYEASTLSSAETMFALSVYNVEYHRSSEGVVQYLRYMAVEETTPQQRTISVALEALLEKVFIKFLRDPNMREQRYHQTLEALCLEALHSTVHVHPRVSRVALTMLPRILTQFPYMQYNRAALWRALDLVSVLERATSGYLNDDYEPVYTFSIGNKQNDGTASISNCTDIVNDELVLVLPDSLEHRKQSLQALRGLISRWMRPARDRSSAQVVSLLQSYIIERRQPNNFGIGRQGVAYAMKVLGEIENEGSRQSTLSNFVAGLSARSHYEGELNGLSYWIPRLTPQEKANDIDPIVMQKFKADASVYIQALKAGKVSTMTNGYSDTMYRTLAVLSQGILLDPDLTRVMVWAPIYIFTFEAVSLATELWSSLLQRFPNGELRLLMELSRAWQHLIRHERGVFCLSWKATNPFHHKMQNSAERQSFKDAIIIKMAMASMDGLIEFLSNRWESVRGKNQECVNAIIDMMFNACSGTKLSTHPLSRATRFNLLTLALRISSKTVIEDEVLSFALRERIDTTALHWFTLEPVWSNSRSKTLAYEEIKSLAAFWHGIQQDKGWRGSTGELNASGAAAEAGKYGIDADMATVANATSNNMKAHALDRDKRRELILLLLANEISKLTVWCDPLGTTFALGANSTGITSLPQIEQILQMANQSQTAITWKQYVRDAWNISPAIAIHMGARFNNEAVHSELRLLVVVHAKDAIQYSEAIRYLLTSENISQNIPELTYLVQWAPMAPITAITLFQPEYKSHPAVLQYAMRSLFSFPIDTVFFYIPQIVQALRHDPLGYVEEFILRAAKTSQLFAHQIIWNMNANMYRDEEGNDPDSLKPAFDRITSNIVSALSGSAQAFYEREFTFFNKVTAISGKLKPFIKRSKPEKKKKIDEELRLIKVDVGVYLPSNPESTVIDIDYDSGRPLQSHAKAPFMAKFKTRRAKPDTTTPIVNDSSNIVAKKYIQHEGHDIEEEKEKEETWQSAIFKVGDDCRQDLLALQLIAIFKNVFRTLGLDLYLFPYRVVATAPGCGVIEVIPHAISRDEMGREKINSLVEYFLHRYGPVTRTSRQRARNCFVQSLAAYSVVLYLLQIKDRHNGNIMVDDHGHIVHIDFGFILDISPGGINFESSPFKLTTEMIQVIGGGTGTEMFTRFCELVVKAYLALRPYVDEITAMVALMAASGLPCFKSEATVRRLRARFCIDRNDRDAASFMLDRINESYENRRTVMYDKFQRQTNGIPY